MKDGPILVIKLGALGDLVLAFPAFQAIRDHHPGRRVVLLTTAPFAGLMARAPWFDAVWTDPRARWWQPGAWLGLRRRLRAAGFARVYDLQTSARSSLYFTLLRPGPRPEWSGVARGCSHPDPNPDRTGTHAAALRRIQLAAAGIPALPSPDLGWLDAPLEGFALPPRPVLLVPGGAAHRPAKRWPAPAYARLAGALAADGLDPVLVGTRTEAAATAAIAAAVPAALDLTGRTGLADLAALARRAVLAIGNDTGPMHLAAAAGCPSLVLFSAASDPALSAPPGARVLRREPLTALAPEEVLEAARALVARTANGQNLPAVDRDREGPPA